MSSQDWRRPLPSSGSGSSFPSPRSLCRSLEQWLAGWLFANAVGEPRSVPGFSQSLAYSVPGRRGSGEASPATARPAGVSDIPWASVRECHHSGTRVTVMVTGRGAACRCDRGLRLPAVAATKRRFAGTWQAHARRLKITRTGDGREWFTLGVGQFVFALRFHVSQPRGRLTMRRRQRR
jgi:hypothetical protein